MEKIIYNADSFDSAKFLEDAKAAGIASTKLDKARETYSLPESGKFTFSGAEIVPEDGEIGAFIRLLTDSGYRISVNNLLATASFVGTKEKVEFKKSESKNSDGTKKESFGAFFVKGERLNQSLMMREINPKMIDNPNLEVIAKKITIRKLTTRSLSIVLKKDSN